MKITHSNAIWNEGLNAERKGGLVGGEVVGENDAIDTIDPVKRLRSLIHRARWKESTINWTGD